MLHLKLSALSKSFLINSQRKTAFENVDLEINKGEFVAIVGPSGCGKTSLLRVIAGLDKASTGNLQFNEQISKPNLAMVFQEHGLFPWMTLKKNIRVVLQNSPAVDRSKIDSLCNRYIQKIGLSEFADYYPHQVSGGMRQRVNIARSFASQPDVLLMDEPFVFLDYQTRLSLQEMLLEIWNETRQTVIFVTHDIEEAALLADRVLLMTAGPGQIASQIKIEIDRPRDIIQLKGQKQFIQPVSEMMQFLKNQGLKL